MIVGDPCDSRADVAFCAHAGHQAIGEFLPAGPAAVLPTCRGIRWHTDLYLQNGREGYGKHVVGLSLLSDTVFWFRNRDGHEVSVFVPRRSMYLFYGPLRYEWQHSIRNCAPEESMGPRYALTFCDN